MRSEVRAGAIRIDISDPEQWSVGDTAILRNQKAKQVRDIGSLIFETPIQHDYEAGVEVRSLLSTERLEEMDGRLVVTDKGSHAVRYVKFWVDDTISSPAEGRASSLGEEAPSRVSYASIPPFPSLSARDVGRVPTSPERRDRPPPDQSGPDRSYGNGSPVFGGGVRFDDDETYEKGHIPEGARSQARTPQTRQKIMLPRMFAALLWNRARMVL